jgi:hypothetical protein
MVRPLAAAGVALAVLALAACGHRAAGAQPPPQNSATLGAYVVDATPASPAPPGQPGQAPQTAGKLPTPACSQGQDAYKVLVFLVSSDTGTSVQTIVADLRTGQTLSDVAGARSGLVEQQAMQLVEAWLQFAQANGSVTANQVTWYRTIALGVIGSLMTADVSDCIPAGG